MFRDVRQLSELCQYSVQPGMCSPCLGILGLFLAAQALQASELVECFYPALAVVGFVASSVRPQPWKPSTEGSETAFNMLDKFQPCFSLCLTCYKFLLCDWQCWVCVPHSGFVLSCWLEMCVSLCSAAGEQNEVFCFRNGLFSVTQGMLVQKDVSHNCGSWSVCTWRKQGLI